MTSQHAAVRPNPNWTELQKKKKKKKCGKTQWAAALYSWSKGYTSTVEKAIKESFTVPSSPSGGLSERDGGRRWGDPWLVCSERGGYIYQTSRSGGVKCPPGVTSEVSVSAFGSKAKMERFTAIGDEDGRGGVIDPENKKNLSLRRYRISGGSQTTSHPFHRKVLCFFVCLFTFFAVCLVWPMRVSSYLTNDLCDPRLRIVFFYWNYMEVSFYDEKKQKKPESAEEKN